MNSPLSLSVSPLLSCQCVDLSCNELSEITLPENLPPKLQELDLTGNPRLSLDHKTLEQLKLVSVHVCPSLMFP